MSTKPPRCSTPTVAAAIDENSGAGQMVYDANAHDQATDGGPSDPLTYALAGLDVAAFTIDASTGEVTLTGDPDFEAQSSYSFDVTATDAAGNHTTQTVTLAINNLDEVAPTMTSSAVATAINENSGAGQTIYTVTATDIDDISGGVSFSMKAVDDAAAFTVDADTGAVTLLDNPDYESKSSYSFTVIAADAAGHLTEQQVTLAINNRDEVAPSITSAAAATAIVENSGAGQVGLHHRSHRSGDRRRSLHPADLRSRRHGCRLLHDQRVHR